MSAQRVHEGETRSLDRLREHYEVERELADRLRAATADERRRLYAVVYDELFRRVPDHSQLARKRDPGVESEALEMQMGMIAPFLTSESTFVDVGAGDCALSIAIASTVRCVYAIDVSTEITAGLSLPSNVEVRISDGVEIPVAPESADVIWSNQLMEHLHPDDALEQVRNIYRSLKPGGRYICVTPHRLTGPHDISRHFDQVATCFHLKEYTVRDLWNVFRSVGFSEFRILAGGRGRYRAVDARVATVLERALGRVPIRSRCTLVSRLHLNAVLGIRVVAARPREISMR